VNRERVDSTIIKSIAYDPDAETLVVELRNGDLYQYFRVPGKEYDSFRNAYSMGRYYTKFIKPVYKFKKIR
jgi:hypothetical protein